MCPKTHCLFLTNNKTSCWVSHKITRHFQCALRHFLFRMRQRASYTHKFMSVSHLLSRDRERVTLKSLCTKRFILSRHTTFVVSRQRARTSHHNQDIQDTQHTHTVWGTSRVTRDVFEWVLSVSGTSRVTRDVFESVLSGWPSLPSITASSVSCRYTHVYTDTHKQF